MNRKKLTLAILLVIFVLSLVYSYVRQPKQQRATSLKYPPGAVAVTGRATLNKQVIMPLDDKKLHLELLDREPGRSAGTRRNIFAPVFKEELKPLPFRPAPPAVKLPLPPPPPATAVTPPSQIVEPSPLQKDMAKITFLGFLKKENQKTVFLSSDKQIFVVKKGDTIAGKYDVTNVTDDALTIYPKSGGGEIVIPLVENKSLTAPRQAK
jgi:hypothetical protein